MTRLLAITGALADENRVRILASCRAGELCVCQIIELLDLAPSTVSKHLFLLKNAGLLESRKEGRWMYYQLAGSDAPPNVREFLNAVLRSASTEKRILDDEKRLKEILRMDPEALCLKQRTDSACCSSAPATRAGAKWRKAGRAASKAT